MEKRLGGDEEKRRKAREFEYRWIGVYEEI